jgi:peptidoglycan/LPS O-acetylase OafA/YrhL
MIADSRRTPLASRLDPRANSLNAIRLVLAATVIVSHSWPIGQYGRTPSHGGFAPGGWAVDAFFVLSGYLITGSRLNNTLLSYLKRRVLRIYPGFVVCLLSVVIIFAPIGYIHDHHSLHGYVSTPHTPVSYVLSNLGLRMHVTSVADTPGGNGAWAGTLWTLFYEFFCYLIVGLLASWIAFRRQPALAIFALAAVTAVSIQNAHVNHVGIHANMVRLLPFFLAGTVIYQLREWIPCTWWLAGLCTGALVVLPLAGIRFVVLCALPLTYVLLYLGAVVPIAIGRRNDISYGIYMYGYPVEQLVRYFTFGSQAVFILVSILGTVPLAAASWFFVERPAMRWRRGDRSDPPRVIRLDPKRVVVDSRA